MLTVAKNLGASEVYNDRAKAKRLQRLRCARVTMPKLGVTAGVGRGQPEPREFGCEVESASLVLQRIQAMTTMRPMMARTVQTMPMVLSLLLLLVFLGGLLEMRYQCSDGHRR